MGKAKKQLGVHLTSDGAEFRVWAPNASNVLLALDVNRVDFGDWDRIPMKREENGIWAVHVSNAAAGQNYKYLIETPHGTLKKNDPRARQLTASDTGNSVVVDDYFDWQDDNFTCPPPEKQVIYELHIGTFNRPDAATAGTFSTAIEKLDYLKDELGINMIELMPVTSMAMSAGWGYAPNHLFSVESSYGGRHGMLEFVRACHARGIGVILDVVYNHFSKITDLWRFDGWSENGQGGIYFYNDERGKTPWGGRPDYGRPEVREFLLDNVTMWFAEYHIDGLRVDSTIYLRSSKGHNNDPVYDISDAWSLLAEMTTRAHEINDSAILIAEDCAGNEYITKDSDEGGLGFDAQWELNFPHALRDALGINQGVGPHIDGISFMLQHRFNGNAFEKVVFSDSHDTAANGAVRLNEAAGFGQAESVHAREQTVLASALTLTAPGIPMLLQGQEFMQGGSFNDWQMLDWTKTEKFSGIVGAHRELIDLRLNSEGNTGGLLGQSTAIFHHDSNNRVIGYHRWSNGGVGDDVLIIANFSKNEFDSNYVVTLPILGRWQVRFCSSKKYYSPEFHDLSVSEFITNEHGQISISLAPYTVFVLSRES